MCEIKQKSKFNGSDILYLHTSSFDSCIFGQSVIHSLHKSSAGGKMNISTRCSPPSHLRRRPNSL